MKDNICKHLDCKEKAEVSQYCLFHYNGGFFENGDAYSQHQIIEEDFIDFIKIVPIDDAKHLQVHSPVLRDIIVRSCIQIELFLMEWLKYKYDSVSNSEKVLKEYNKTDKQTNLPRGSRNWNIKFYYPLIEENLLSKNVYVRPLNKKIEPFKDWKSSLETPFWWKVYNEIKHNGLNNRENANLKCALSSLAAIFLLHLNNPYSKVYLKKYTINKVVKKSSNFVLEDGSIQSPIDTKKYLFSDCSFEYPSKSVIAEDSKTYNRAHFKGKRV